MSFQTIESKISVVNDSDESSAMRRAIKHNRYGDGGRRTVARHGGGAFEAVGTRSLLQLLLRIKA